MSAERTRRVALITLTFANPDYAAAQGAIRDFWNRVRQRHLGAIYFCWLELHRSGALHYHAMWVNPPPVWRRNLIASVDRWWGHGRTQVRFKQANWRDDEMLGYALKYANKMGAKRYQQQYDQLPASLRTFMSSRLEIPATVLKHHINKELFRYVPGHFSKDAHAPNWSTWQPAHLVKIGDLVHETKYLASCTAPQSRIPRLLSAVNRR